MSVNQQIRNTPDKNGITVWGFLKLLAKKAHWLLIAGLAAGLGVYFVVAVLISPTYESCATFYVYNNSGSDSGNHVSAGDLQAASDLAATYSEILESNSVQTAVLNQLDGDSNITQAKLKRMVQVSVVSGTQIIKVVVSSSDPEFSCKVANAFIQVAPTEIVRITKAGGVEIVDRPTVPTEKTAPHTAFDTLIGAVIGVIVACIVIIVREVSDTTVYLTEDVSGVTVLGEIPKIEVPEGRYVYWKLTEGRADCYGNPAVQEKRPPDNP